LNIYYNYNKYNTGDQNPWLKNQKKTGSNVWPREEYKISLPASGVWPNYPIKRCMNGMPDNWKKYGRLWNWKSIIVKTVLTILKQNYLNFKLLGINSTGQIIQNRRRSVETMLRTWKLKKGKILVIEDASTASLVIVARDLRDREDKIAALEEVLRKMRK